MSSALLPAPVRSAHRLLPFLAAGCLVAATAQADPQPDPDPPPPPVIDVPEVTISATRTEQNVLDVPGNVTVIDRAMIDRSGEQTVPDLLRREAGLFVTNTTTNPGSYNVEARGFSNGGGNGCNTLVLVDGRRINEADTSCPDWSFVSLDEVERIEVIRGPVSAMYGDNGVGGVIHIITRQGRAEQGVRAIARGRLGTYDSDGGSLLVEGAEGPFSATAFLDSDRTDAYRDHADFSRDAGDLALRYELGPLASLELGGGYASVDRQQPGDLTQVEWDQNPRQAEPGSGDNSDAERQRFVDSRLELRPFDGVTLTLLPSYQSTSQRTLLEDPTSAFSSQLEMDVWSVPTQLAWDHTLLGRKNQLLVGADWLQEKVDADSLLEFAGFSSPSASHTRRTILGLFLNDELWLREDLLLSLGVRHDHSDTKGEEEIAGTDFHETHSVWSPRAALTWRITEPASLYVSYARGFRFPNRDETFGFFGFTPGLEPEKSESYEIGAKLRRPGLTANLALYHMNVHDEIFLDPVLVQNRNIDRVRHRGLELSGSWQPAAWLELRGSYTYDDVEIQLNSGPLPPGAASIDGSTMPITPEHRGDVAATFFLPHGFEVGGNAYYAGSRILANDVPNTNERLDSFVTYGARIAWKHDLASHLRLGLSVTGYNLSDESYAEFGGVSFALFGPQEIGFFPSPERHYVAAIQLEVYP
jgi:iron complex outermembrane receptor protein